MRWARQIGLLARFACIFSQGYIHPDEFFQSQEVVAADVFHIQAYRSWEFTAAARSRSIAPILLTTGLPYYFHSLFHGWLIPSHLFAEYLLYAPRIWLFCISLLVDRCLLRIVMASEPESRDAVMAFSSTSWVSILIFTRPFSNTLEAALLALSFDFAITKCISGPLRVRFLCALGGILAFGVFCRFTFLFVACPVGLFVVLQRSKMRKESTAAKTDKAAVSMPSIRAGVCLLVGALLVTAACVCVDTIYYGSTLTIAPLNNLLYNLRTANLSEHGLHPRYTHLLVNVPLMFGPAGVSALLLYGRNLCRLSRVCLHLCRSHSRHFSARHVSRLAASAEADAQGNASTAHLRPSRVEAAAAKEQARTATVESAAAATFFDLPPAHQLAHAVIVCYLGALSLAPHQEPRFLAPVARVMVMLLVPLALTQGVWVCRGWQSSSAFTSTTSAIFSDDVDRKGGVDSGAHITGSVSSVRSGAGGGRRRRNRSRSKHRVKRVSSGSDSGASTNESLSGGSLDSGSTRSSRFASRVHMLHTVLLLLFFGTLHQAGVVPALLRLRGHTPTGYTPTQHQPHGQHSHVHLVFLKTYMPPRFLLARHQQLDAAPWTLHDLKGASVGKLCEKLTSLRLDWMNKSSSTTSADEPEILVIAPATTLGTAAAPGMQVEPVCNVNVGSDLSASTLTVEGEGSEGPCICWSMSPRDFVGPHLSMEDPPWEVGGSAAAMGSTWLLMQLGIYKAGGSPCQCDE